MKRLLCAAISVLAAGCLSQGPVVRVMGGQLMQGRFIDERAYEAFLNGELAEQTGQLQTAEEWYQHAHEVDPDGVAPLVRLGAVRCARSPQRSKLAEEAFSAAEHVDATFAPLFIERARCSMRTRQLHDALKAAKTAVDLEPKDVEATLMFGEVLEADGRADQANALFEGYLAWRPGSIEVMRARSALARRHNQGVVASAIDSEVRRAVGDPTGPRHRNLEQIDEALAAGNISAAREAAVRAGVRPGTVAARASALAQWQIAADQIRLVLAADPSDADATAALLALPDASEPILSSVWQMAFVREPNKVGLSTVGALLIADLIARRVGADVAQQFMARLALPAEESSDPLVRRLRARLSSR